MKILRIKNIIFAFIAILAAQNTSAASLDNIYRDIVRSNNSGYLPLFVKNRQQPDILFEDNIDFNTPSHLKLITPDKTLHLSQEFDQSDTIAKARRAQWLKTVAAVKSNQVTPLELDDIFMRVQENDPKAVEILAWMYTKGVGVPIDYVKAFNMYKRAALMNVANAERNALIVYKAMNESQRLKIKNRL